MTLTIKDRLLLLTVLPREGNIVTLRIIRKLRESLSFSEEEHARLGLVEKDNQVSWRTDVPQESEIDIGAKATKIVENTLQDLDKQKKLTEEFLPLWDKFLPAED